jgi:hypothetical protein
VQHARLEAARKEEEQAGRLVLEFGVETDEFGFWGTRLPLGGANP